MNLHNPLGIFNSVYRNLSLEAMARTVRSHRLTHLHFDPLVSSISQDYELTSSGARQVRRLLENHGIEIAALAAYTNLVDPNEERKEQKIRRMERLIELCHDYGTSYVATETGSMNPTSEWDDYPENHTPQAMEKMLAVLARLIEKAKECGVTILIEGYVNNVIATTEEAVQLVNQFGDSNLGFVLDPFNYMKQEDLDQQEAALQRVFQGLGSLSRIAHAKDVIYTDAGIDTPKVGSGCLQWHFYADMLRRYRPDLPLILEHLNPEDVPECKRIVEQAFEYGGGRA